MTRNLKIAAFALACAATLALAMPTALAESYSAHVDGPVVIDGHVFSGGHLELRTVGRGDQLWALLLDGRQVALLFRDTDGWKPAGTHAALVFQVDRRGLAHLSGIEYRGVQGTEPLYRPLRVATVSPGLARVPAAMPAAEGIATARR